MIGFDFSDFRLAHPVSIVERACDSNSFNAVRQTLRSLQRTLVEVKVGEARYRLRKPLTLTFYPFVNGGMGELIPEPDFENPDGWPFIGIGITLEEAINDWKEKVHMLVQNLLNKRSWEMTPQEMQEMDAIERTIDIPAYHRETPYRTRQIGTVTRRRPIPDRIQWEDGLTEYVNLQQMPPEFATYVNGQRFEAITVRDSMNRRLLRVDYIAKLGRLMSAPADQWEKTQTTLNTPAVDWNEID
jgi:hypothetical protein